MNLNITRKNVNAKLFEYNATKTQHQIEKEAYREAKRHSKRVEEALDIAQKVAQVIQQQAHNQISKVVTTCLRTVFEDDYEFRIHFEKKRNRTEARLVFVRDGREMDPLSSSGGGVVDVAAFALRLSCLVLSKPKCRRLLVLDEPFKFVSEEYRPNIKTMITSLSEEFGVQIVMVTHIEEIKTGKVIELCSKER